MHHWITYLRRTDWRRTLPEILPALRVMMATVFHGRNVPVVLATLLFAGLLTVVGFSAHWAVGVLAMWVWVAAFSMVYLMERARAVHARRLIPVAVRRRMRRA
ncbi:hypothetical protein HY632_02620 [Candidatus Uhrbacteria bacterium]|nr:hypothetical protein [Candidatus Uhrbacteria bacterium]